jgi:hypothetical protein
MRQSDVDSIMLRKTKLDILLEQTCMQGSNLDCIILQLKYATTNNNKAATSGGDSNDEDGLHYGTNTSTAGSNYKSCHTANNCHQSHDFKHISKYPPGGNGIGETDLYVVYLMLIR